MKAKVGMVIREPEYVLVYRITSIRKSSDTYRALILCTNDGWVYGKKEEWTLSLLEEDLARGFAVLDKEFEIEQEIKAWLNNAGY